MNVLMCCSDLSYKGGMVSVVKNLLEALPATGGVSVNFVPTHTDGGKPRLIACFAKAYLKIARMARRGEIDVAHLHVAERGSFVRKGILLRLLHRYGIPVVLHHHGAEFDPWHASLGPRMRRWVNDTLTKADVNIVLSPRLIPMISSKAPEARVKAVYNAVPTPVSNRYPVSARGVLLLGRLGERKGAYDLIEAIRMIDTEIPSDIRFYLCGDGEVDEVRRWVETAGLSHRVAHIGWIDGPRKEQILSETMINVLPSYNEGLPMTILETMARGIPNISTPVASIPEVITDGVTGLLVKPGDVPALASAIKKLINDPGLRSRISDASFRQIHERFSLPVIAGEILQIYRELNED
ncbi:MAG: glycosyltransferase family 4 protein [Muribaculaceae bacterium]|nr:glycosyltransferase family 4 protein [Muribaculaceae bacterium]